MTAQNTSRQTDSSTVPRSAGVDAVRVAGILAVVAGHAWSRDATALAFYAWHVPVFFFLSGYLWSGRRSLCGEVEQRLKTLGKPYVFWLAAIALLVAVALPMTGEDPVERLAEAAYGGAAAVLPFTTFWFVSVLFFAVIAYKMLSPYALRVQWIFAIVGVAAGALLGPVLAGSPLSIGSALPCVAYLVAGRTAKMIRQHIKRPLLLGMAMVVASFLLVLLGFSEPLDIKNGNYGTPVLSFVVACCISWGLVLILEVAFRSAPDWLSQFATWFSVAGFTIVLVHPVFLWSPTPPVGDFLAGVLVPLVIGRVALRTPLAQWLTGQRRPEKGVSSNE